MESLYKMSVNGKEAFLKKSSLKDWGKGGKRWHKAEQIGPIVYVSEVPAWLSSGTFQIGSLSWAWPVQLHRAQDSEMMHLV